jgi:hypothetical protein
MADRLAEQEFHYMAQLRRALQLVEDALDVLDLAGGPEDASASLEQSRSCLETHLQMEH